MSLIFPTVLLLGAFLAAFIPILVLIGTVRVRRRHTSGFMHLIPYGIVITSALLIAYAGRDFSVMLNNPSMVKPALLTWGQRVFTVVMLLASGERLGSYILGTRERHAHGPLAVTFGLYWLCAALLPMFTGRYSTWSHEIAYPLLMGLAALTLGTTEAERLVAATRNSIVLFTLASWAMVVVSPHAVLESNYAQGYLPGVPRLAGLAAHAVALGMLVQIGMFCLWAKPFRRKALNVLAWTAMVAALFLSQAKAAWISALVCSLVMLQTRSDGQLLRRLFNSRAPMLGSALIVVLTLAAVAGVAVLTIKGQNAAAFLSTREGAQLASLTGRDVIWSAALDEWRKYPIFGFGTELFSVPHRASLGLPSAIHAHNQLIDTLARAGLAGAIPFVAYLLMLGYYAFKFNRETQGLSSVLYLALFIRGIGEIPFNLSGYGHEFLTHFLLLAVIASASREARLAKIPLTADLARERPSSEVACVVPADHHGNASLWTPAR